jgi:hypothetical protein
MPEGAAALNRMLSARAPDLVAQLLPAGHREGHEWVHPTLTGGSSKRALSVHLTGAKAGLWGDFASGETGDALDLVATLVCAGSIIDAMAWARRFLGLCDGPVPAERRRVVSAPADPDTMRHEEAASRKAAIAMFLRGAKGLADAPVAAYLAGRGIDLAELARQPASLRFHPEVWNRETDRRLPAMLAAVTDDKGEMVAVHRTWLARDHDGRWVKAPLTEPKKSLGRLGGGSIRLWRGASGKRLADAPAGETVAIGEGIETALSVVMACPELRVLSAVSLANMASIVLPPAIATVILLKDEDGDNLATKKGLERAIDHFLRDGRIVKIARPPVGKDFNDTLQAEDPH